MQHETDDTTVLNRSRTLADLLKARYGASGVGLEQLVSSVVYKLPIIGMLSLRRISEIRDKILNDRQSFPVQVGPDLERVDRHHFEQLCSEVETLLIGGESSLYRKGDRATEQLGLNHNMSLVLPSHELTQLQVVGSRPSAYAIKIEGDHKISVSIHRVEAEHTTSFRSYSMPDTIGFSYCGQQIIAHPLEWQTGIAITADFDVVDGMNGQCQALAYCTFSNWPNPALPGSVFAPFNFLVSCNFSPPACGASYSGFWIFVPWGAFYRLPTDNVNFEYEIIIREAGGGWIEYARSERQQGIWHMR